VGRLSAGPAARAAPGRWGRRGGGEAVEAAQKIEATAEGGDATWVHARPRAAQARSRFSAALPPAPCRLGGVGRALPFARSLAGVTEIVALQTDFARNWGGGSRLAFVCAAAWQLSSVLAQVKASKTSNVMPVFTERSYSLSSISPFLRDVLALPPRGPVYFMEKKYAREGSAAWWRGRGFVCTWGGVGALRCTTNSARHRLLSIKDV
jgi:hypothetical protein